MNIIRAAFAPVLTLLICAGPAFALSNPLVIPSVLPLPVLKGHAGIGINLDSGTDGFWIVIFFFLLVVIFKTFCGGRPGWMRGEDTRTIVFADFKYPNNHHVRGVGYYHAAQRRWFPLPWNEFREGRQYYHGGAWHPDPAPETGMTSPDPEHVQEVNQLWRQANPEKMNRLWDDVERRGFGQAVESLENHHRGS